MRWLGRKVVAERTYLRVTGVDRIAVSRSETTTDSNGRSRSRTVDDWSLQFMSNGTEIERIGAPRDKVDPAYDKGQAWFGGEARQSAGARLFRVAIRVRGDRVRDAVARGDRALHESGRCESAALPPARATDIAARC